MLYDNEGTRLHREVLRRVARLFFQGPFPEGLSRIPLELRPLGSPATRCCVHHDRAIIKYRCMAVLGFSVEQEEDELTPLADYGRRALARTELSSPILTVIDEACSGCVRAQYMVTNACHHCMARPCLVNCPKEAISVETAQARIDHTLCVNCGICAKVCPYHAVVRVPIPCEEACPVGAITNDEQGKEDIDYDKCIFCGQCMEACPFGAVMEKSEIVDVLQALTEETPVIAMVAPSVQGQFGASLPHVAGALERLGFEAVAEVARGADFVAEREADEFVERMGRGDRFMTTSCCAAYTEAVEKHVPDLAPFVSSVETPTRATAAWVRRHYPDTVNVFIGPCVAKRKEAVDDPSIDYVLTFEEVAALFAAADIDVSQCDPATFIETAHREGRSFPVAGGVAKAVAAFVGNRTKVEVTSINGLSAKSMRLLEIYARKSCPGNLVEVMGCAGGCVAGPGVVAKPSAAARGVRQAAEAVPPRTPRSTKSL